MRHDIFAVRSTCLLMAVVLFSLAARPQERYTAVAVTKGGSVSGTVRLVGHTPGPELMPVTKNEEVCGRNGVSPRLVVGRNSGVRYAVVYLDGVAKGKAETMTLHPQLNQLGCAYVPHVFLAPVGSQLEIVNSDPILHNIHAYEGVGTSRSLCNIAQPVKGQSTTLKEPEFTKPGIVSFSCDAGHPWMSAYLIIVKHPYYCVTDDDGRFSLSNVPPGTYTLRLWHEGVRVREKQLEKSVVIRYAFEDPYELAQTVVVEAGKNVTSDFNLALRETP